MKNAWAVLLAVVISGPALAQDETGDEYPEYGEPAADESYGGEDSYGDDGGYGAESGGDEGSTDYGSPDDGSTDYGSDDYGSGDTGAGDAGTDDYGAPDYGTTDFGADTGYTGYDTGGAFEEAAAEEPAEGLPLYAALDLVQTTFSSSGVPGFGVQDYDSGMYRLKFGTRVFENKVGLEFHYGVDNGGDGAGEASTDSYYGFFMVPTGTVLETVEVSLPVGYAMNSVSRRGAGADLDSIAFGFDAALPLAQFGEGMPDLRIGLGWMVYYQKSSARMYGANLGIRYDFTTRSFGNPFAGMNWNFWPFGGDGDE